MKLVPLGDKVVLKQAEVEIQKITDKSVSRVLKFF